LYPTNGPSISEAELAPTQMMPAQFVGWSAILAGLAGLIGFVFLLLFFALEASGIFGQGEPAKPPLFGTLNDASYIPVALLMLPIALALYQRTRTTAPVVSLLSLAVGLAGLLMLVVCQALYVPRIIQTARQSPLIALSIGVIGLWLVVENELARRAGSLPAGLGWLGIATGLGMLLMPVVYFVLGGSTLANDPQAGLSNPGVMAGFALGVLAIGIGWPVWAILAGRSFLVLFK